jgi:hypothetical protein
VIAASSSWSAVGKNIGDKSMMKSVLFWLLAIVFLIIAPDADAQQPGKILRIGFLDASNAAGMAGLLEAFQQQMRKLGWIEGKNITIEYGLPSKSLRACLNLRRSWFV